MIVKVMSGVRWYSLIHFFGGKKKSLRCLHQHRYTSNRTPVMLKIQMSLIFKDAQSAVQIFCFLFPNFQTFYVQLDARLWHFHFPSGKQESCRLPSVTEGTIFKLKSEAGSWCLAHGPWVPGNSLTPMVRSPSYLLGIPHHWVLISAIVTELRHHSTYILFQIF